MKKLSILMLSILLIFAGCGGGDTDTTTDETTVQATPTAVEYTESVARLITQATGGTIKRDDEIRVRFSVAVGNDDELKEILKRDLFSFTPKIKGTVEWEDSRTIVFKADELLPMRTSYQAKLNVPAIMETFQESPTEAFEFTFQTRGRELGSYTADFDPVSSNDPRNVYLRGTVRFTEDTDINLVKNNITLDEDGVNRKLNWKQGNTGREFLFESETLIRTEERKAMNVVIGKGLELSKDTIEKVHYLSPLQQFTVSEVTPYTEGSSKGFSVRFSDDLASRQNLDGFITCSPRKNISIRVDGSMVYVTGDFSYGSSYQISVNKGVASKWGTKTQTKYTRDISFEDLKPEMEFLHDGVFLTSASDRRIFFKTVNLYRVHISVMKVFENNLGQFLQTEQLVSSNDRTENFNSSYTSRVGVNVASQTLEITNDKNQWMVNELDLATLIDPKEKGLFLLSVSFERSDMNYKFSSTDRYYYGDDYYSNPNSSGYVYAHGRIYKPLVVSDVGLTWKQTGDKQIIFASDLLTAEPQEGVQVTLKTYQNQVIATGKTDKDGKIEFPRDYSQSIFYILGEKGDYRTVIKANEMSWNLSSFDTEGINPSSEGIRTYLYTDRGVYRPGDTIYLSAIVRNRENTFPANHPVSVKFYNPKGQMVDEKVSTKGKDGFYSFDLETKDSDPTGGWRVEFISGASTFGKDIQVETIVPNRLRINLELEKKRLGPDDKQLNLDFISTYLFGAPAAELEAELKATIQSREVRFSRFSDFIFKNDTIEYKQLRKTIFRSYLDDQGFKKVTWNIPDLGLVPSGVTLALEARVFEDGGRATVKNTFIPIDPFDAYVGIKKPDMKYGYMKIGEKNEIPLVVVDQEGEPLAGRKVEYKLYKNSRYWWWEYSSYSDFRLRYKTDSETKVVDSGAVTSGQLAVNFDIEPESWGEYFLEVTDEGGHTAGFFFYASRWGAETAQENEGQLPLSTDKKQYNPGDTAVISMPSPKNGRILVTVEKGDRLLSYSWENPTDEETLIEIPITKDMIPTSYVSVSLMQPHDQTYNDRPIRMYGVVPLNVSDAETNQGIDIIMDEELKPEKEFTVTVQTRDKKKTQYTVAVVDEGLLDITNFQTPNPWNYFYQKQRLNVTSYDMFSQVIGAYNEDIFKTFSIGGGGGFDEEEVEEGEEKKRFKPVVFFSGPLETDDSGKGSVSFTMENYLGSVRVMVISANEDRYGRVEKAVPVRTDLMILPTLPRVLGPGENIKIPVTLFALKDKLGSIQVSAEVKGPVKLVGDKNRFLKFDKIGELDTFFELTAEERIGMAEITLTVKSATETSYSTINLPIRASSPPIYSSEEKSVQAGNEAEFLIPDNGIPGTRSAKVTISRFGDMNLNHRLKWLIRYPHGCIEQTMSAVFPQLFLKDFMKTDTYDIRQIDGNINAGIDRLRKFQTSSGGFSYWPGGNYNSAWGTNYGGHFMLEASKLGYFVPADLKDNWVKYQKSRALTGDDDLSTRVYRVYLLALAGKPETGAMNLLKENSFSSMTNVQKWILAGAYKLAGMDSVAESLSRNLGTSVSDYNEFSGTYGSALRDKAMILEMTTLLGEQDIADKLFRDIGKLISQDTWYSTQTVAYSLLSLGKYILATESGQDDLLAGTITLPDGSRESFSTGERVFAYDIVEGFGKKVKVSIDGSAKGRFFVIVDGEGTPLTYEETEDVSKNLRLRVKWYDDNGNEINPSQVVQGENFWGYFEVSKTEGDYVGVDEIALTQILPAGWEIENTRLSGESRPSWMGSRSVKFGREEFMDIRDDRISWYFDLPRYENFYGFYVKVLAVTEGSYSLPPTICEAMYRSDYRALIAGKDVKVIGKN